MDTESIMTGGGESTAGAARELPGGEDDVLLPEGWNQGDDIFADPETWTGEGEVSTAEEQAQPPADEPEDIREGPPSADEPEGTPGEEPGTGEEAAAGEAGDQRTETPKKLRFRAGEGQEEQEVELDESELPGLYRRAQEQGRQSDRLTKAEAMAKRMGYESLEDMLGKAEDRYAESEVQRLTADGVHEEVARDMVRRRMDAATAGQTGSLGTTGTGGRDFRAETLELLEARPALRGQKLPEEVVRDCVQSGKHLMTAYAEYETRQERAESERLKERLRILEQNQAAAARGPVKGATGGGQTDNRSEDPFLKGFDSDD